MTCVFNQTDINQDSVAIIYLKLGSDFFTYFCKSRVEPVHTANTEKNIIISVRVKGFELDKIHFNYYQ